METLDPRDGTTLYPSGMVGRIYLRDHWTLLHAKYVSCGPHG